MAMSTVTLEKAYFETLLRRAQFHTGGVDYTTPVHVPTVTIPKADHDSLLSSVRQYANLRRNLYRGGIADETLAVLIQDDGAANEDGVTAIFPAVDEISDGGAFPQQQSSNNAPATGGRDYTFGRNSKYTPRSDPRPKDSNGFHTHSQMDDFAFMPEGNDGFYDGGSGNNDSQSRFQRQQYDKFAKRTILLANLPEAAIHSDIVAVVRGGMLLDIYLRTHDRTASVSFLEEAAAHEFFRHVKRHDLYVRGKRVGTPAVDSVIKFFANSRQVDIRWNDRQFILPGHVANKIAIGATRNLVIQNRSPKHTEEMIRDDLEHIHNLVVINVSFSGQNAYISTNSVHNAMFARTCMMSRATYKGSKIEWDNDECAAPLERPLQTRKENISPKKKDAPLMNRFQLLNLDGTDDDSEADEHDASGITLPTAMTASTLSVIA